MKYRLIDLGRPEEYIWSKAFIHTPEENLLIKGGRFALTNYLKRDFRSPYFGKLVDYPARRRRTWVISGNGVKVQLKPVLVRNRKPHSADASTKRTFYEFVCPKYGIVLKRVRRLPTKWINDIKIYTQADILVASDFLEEHGFIVGAQVLRNVAEKETDSSSSSSFLL